MSPQSQLLKRAKERAKRHGREFSIGPEDIVIPEICPVLGIPLEINVGSFGGKPNSPSLDRIDNGKGYIKGNVQVISHRANAMKADASPEDLLSFARWVFENYEHKQSD